MKKIAVVGAIALLAASSAFAESDVNTTSPGPTTASAKLDIEVVVPRVLFLQVGTGSNMADLNTVDKISFDVPSGSMGDGNPVAGTGGDQGSAVTVKLFGNNGNITLSAATTSNTTGLMNSAPSSTLSIPWSDIDVTSTPGTAVGAFQAAAITHPAINGAASTVSATSNVVRKIATWTYAYKNTSVYAAGTYGGTAALNGRITYTASMP
jgi:hypothetical protein